MSFSDFCSRYHLSQDEVCELFDHWLMVRARSMRIELRKALKGSHELPPTAVNQTFHLTTNERRD